MSLLHALRRLSARRSTVVARSRRILERAARPVVESLEQRQLLTISLPQGLTLPASNEQALVQEFENAGMSQDQVDAALSAWVSTPQVLSVHAPFVPGTTAGGEGGGLAGRGNLSQQQSNSMEFDTGGVVATFQFAGSTWNMYGRECAVQADGMVLVAGQGLPAPGYTSSINSLFLVTRFDANGNLDTSFSSDYGSNGIVCVYYGGCADQIAIDPSDGSILVGGTLRHIEFTNQPPYIPDFTPYQQVMRLDADGNDWQWFATDSSDRRAGYNDATNPSPMKALAVDPLGISALMVSGRFTAYNPDGSVTYRSYMSGGSLGLSVGTPSVDDYGQATLTGSISNSATLLVDWGDGTAQTLSADGSFSLTHGYWLAGAYKAEVLAMNGSDDAAEADISVDNITPVETSFQASPSPAVEGNTVSFGGTIGGLPPSFWQGYLQLGCGQTQLQSHTVSIDWGDGSDPTVLYSNCGGVEPMGAGGLSFGSVSHQYLDDPASGDSYPVAVSVDAGEATTTSVEVADAAPDNLSFSVNSNNWPVREDSCVYIQGSYHDAGICDDATVTVNWGDGSDTDSFWLGSPAANNHYDGWWNGWVSPNHR